MNESRIEAMQDAHDDAHARKDEGIWCPLQSLEKCAQEDCMWWDARKTQCAIQSIADGIWALVHQGKK